jgi:plasmid stability protein
LKNFHLPLPEEIHDGLRAEAGRQGKPSTAVAREAIAIYLREMAREERHRGIAEFAGDAAGSDLDLDEALERVSNERLERDEG